MSERQLTSHVRRIRQELTPSPAAKAAVNGFLEEPDEGLHFYTTFQREIPLTGDYQGAYETSIRNAERIVRGLADRSFVLYGSVFVHESDQALRLLFDVEDNDRQHFRELADAMNQIAPVTDPDQAKIYVDLPKKNLKRDAVLRQQAGALLSSQLRHPAARKKLYVNRARLITRDIGLLAIPDVLPVAPDE
jgi:hypothetical protein